MGHVKGAINIPPAKIMRGEPAELTELPRDTELIVYCLSGSRSNASIPYLRNMGFTNIVNGINKNHVTARYL
jgi:phage shock protein E